MTMKLVPFAALLPPKGNPRKTYDKASIEGLAQSITKDGVIQNLVVRPEGEDHLRVIIGRRRYLALKHLHEHDKIDDGYKVPVSVRKQLPQRDADRISTVENVQREPMHPIDEAEAFANLLQGGADIAYVAVETGMSVQTVRRRLALASLSDEAKTAVREGTITLGIAEALTLGTVEQQLQWLREIESGSEIDAEDIRGEMLSGKPSVAMAVFPIEQYMGTLARDLFADEESTYFDDVEQFVSLQRQAVEELAEKHRASGTSVEVLEGYSPPWWQYRPAQEGEAGGVIIHHTPNGLVEVREGLVRHPVEAVSAAVTSESPLVPKQKKERPPYTTVTCRYAALHQSSVVQAELLSDPRAAKEVVAVILLLGHDTGAWVQLRPHDAVTALAKEAPQSPSRLAVVAQAEAILVRLTDSSAKNKSNNVEAWQRLLSLSQPIETTYERIRALSDAELDQLIAYTVILSFGRTVLDRPEPGKSFFGHVGHHLALDLRKYWTPDRTFLAGLSREDLRSAAIESGASVQLSKLGTMTKKDLVEVLARYFEKTVDPSANLDEHDEKGRTWVPVCMALNQPEKKTKKRAA